jgi:ferrous iron transport protein B
MGVEEHNWPATVALFTGLFAKEAIVGTLNGLYSQLEPVNGDIEATEPIDESFSLADGLTEALSTIPTNLLAVLAGFLDPLGVSVISDDGAAVAEEIGADESIFTSMQAYFTQGPIQVYAYLLFVLLYVPCIAAMGAVMREIGAKLAMVLAIYLTLLAWIVSTLVYQIGVGHQALWIAAPLIMLALMAFVLKLLGKSYMRANFKEFA